MEEKYKLMLFNNGLMSELYRAGFIGIKPFLYRDLYLWCDAQMKTRGICKTAAVMEAALKFDCNERTVWNALRSFD
jgi:hypothetical protein